MKKCITLIAAVIFVFFSCAQNQNLSEEETEKYRKYRMRYERGQTP